MNSASSTMFVTAPTATFPILTRVLPLPSKIDAFGAPPMLTNAAKAGALDYLAVISTLFVILGFLMIFRNTLQGLGYSTMAVISGVADRPQLWRLAGPARAGLFGHQPGQPHRLGLCAVLLRVYGNADAAQGG